ncbi:hypothetical protein FPV16_10135 [Methylobacterium sp. W2]|nr:hypothetical protein [Methylobacterium sp. W2]
MGHGFFGQDRCGGGDGLRHDGNRSFDLIANNPPPSAGEGACGAGGRGNDLSGRGAPLSRPTSWATLPRRGGREEAR